LVVAQSVIIGVLGYGLGLGLTQLASQLLDKISIPIQVQIRGSIFLWSFSATLLFCVLASVTPAVKIIRTDPEVVFLT
jgi:putative ABC transport system permease protein